MRKDITDGSILIISHQERILQIAVEIVVISDGVITKSGAGAEVLATLMGKDSLSYCPKGKEMF